MPLPESTGAGGLGRQVLGYGLVGGVQLVVDWLCFVLLTFLGLAVAPANLAGRVAGATLGFALNHRFTFAGGERGAAPPGRAFVRFLLFWLLATLLSTLAVTALDQFRGLQAAWLGKPVIDAALAALGFLASRYWIYR